MTCSRSCTRSTYAREAAPTLRRSSGVGDERAQPLAQRLLRRRDERHLDAEGLLGAAHGLVVQERDDRLAERHRLDREDPVPAGVQLVDDDVGRAVALERLVVMEALDELEVGVEPLARGDHVLGALAPAAARARARSAGARGRTAAPARSARGRSRAGSPPPPAPSGSRRSEPTIWASARFAEGELLGRLAADVRAEVVEDGLLAAAPSGSGTGATAGRASARSRSGRRRCAAAAAASARHCAPAARTSGSRALAVERPVRLGVELVAVEDDELRVDAARAQRLDVRPRHARRVDRAVDDAERAVGRLWSTIHALGAEIGAHSCPVRPLPSIAPWVGGGW